VAVSQAWTPFPDCTGVITNRDQDAEVINIEFEYRSSSFWEHRAECTALAEHAPAAKWWVVCWHDDLSAHRRDDLPGVEVVSLREILLREGRAQAEYVVLNWYDGEPADPVRPEDVESKFNWRAKGLSPDRQRIVERLRSYSRSDYVVQWLPRPDIPAFTVRIGGIESFKVAATGTIAFLCPRWPEDRRTAVLERLATECGNNWFIGKERRKKSCDLTAIFRAPEDVEPLVAVLRGLSS
jgi:hypothetical protein